VQLEVFQALQKTDELYTHKVRSSLKDRGIQVSDRLGAFVFEDYKDQGGSIAADLLEENSVLEDRELIEALLENRLRDAAEAERARLGFAWADAATSHDWSMFHDYGRVYKSDIEPDAKAQKRLNQIAKDVSALEEREKDDTLSSDEADMVRPEEAVAPSDTQTSSGDASKADDDSDTEISLGNALEEDLKVERAMALGLAFAQNPKIASDLAMFKLVQDAAVGGIGCTYAFGISASVEHRRHTRMDEIDQTASSAMQDIFEALDLDWCNEDTSPADQFEAFRNLKPSAKDKLVAYALGLTIKPCATRHSQMDNLMHHIEPQVMPDVRAIWTPNAAFFTRLKKADLLRLLSVDLGLVEEANNLNACKKADIVAFCDTLFAEPFATLTDAQREAVAHWCPPGMQTEHPAGDTVVSITDGKATSKAA